MPTCSGRRSNLNVHASQVFTTLPIVPALCHNADRKGLCYNIGEREAKSMGSTQIETPYEHAPQAMVALQFVRNAKGHRHSAKN
ncbi:hypothetical protein KEM55_000019 [Ascosphaera atra]|nr:hypothetical protein KEM55_000019 [Ascosphaera atra]